MVYRSCGFYFIFSQVLQEDPADHKLALSSYSKGIAGARAGAAGDSGDRSGLNTHQAAWTNIAVLHEHMGNPVEAMSAYEQAFSENGSGLRRSDENVDSDALLRITDPANQLFWEWKELPTTASVLEGSRTVRTSVSIGGGLRKGTQVRVGEHYVTTAQGPEKDGEFEVADVAPAGVGGLALEGPLYKKVHRIRVTKDNVSMVFNLALLHEKQGHHEAAQELHKAVLAEHPTYVNSKPVVIHLEERGLFCIPGHRRGEVKHMNGPFRVFLDVFFSQEHSDPDCAMKESGM